MSRDLVRPRRNGPATGPAQERFTSSAGKRRNRAGSNPFPGGHSRGRKPQAAPPDAATSAILRKSAAGSQPVGRSRAGLPPPDPGTHPAPRTGDQAGTKNPGVRHAAPVSRRPPHCGAARQSGQAAATSGLRNRKPSAAVPPRRVVRPPGRVSSATPAPRSQAAAPGGKRAAWSASRCRSSRRRLPAPRPREPGRPSTGCRFPSQPRPIPVSRPMPHPPRVPPTCAKRLSTPG